MVIAGLVATVGGVVASLVWPPAAAPVAALAAVLVLGLWTLQEQRLPELRHYAHQLERGGSQEVPRFLAGSAAELALVVRRHVLMNRDLSGREHSAHAALGALNRDLMSLSQAWQTFRSEVTEIKVRFDLDLEAVWIPVQEMGGVAVALGEASAEGRDGARKLELSTTAVVEHIDNLAGAVDETAASIEEMTYSIREVARNIEDLSLAAEQTATSMNEMDSSISEVDANVKITAALADEVSRDAATGAEAVHRTLEGIDAIRATVTMAADVITVLGKRIREIGNILGVIEDVAEQTNLLALNAAIIAAQAGEHGRGFAVVADEIKELADKTGASTKEISALIYSIQEESRRAVEAIAVGESKVHEGVELSREAEEALAKILQSAVKSTERVNNIASASREQARGSKIVADAVERIAHSVQQVAAATSEQARGSDQLMHHADRIKVITSQVEKSNRIRGEVGTQLSGFGRLVETQVRLLAALEARLQEARHLIGHDRSALGDVLAGDGLGGLVEMPARVDTVLSLTAPDSVGSSVGG